MMSLRRRLNNGLAAILFLVFAVHWFAADWVIRAVAEHEMLTRLAHDSDSLWDTLTHSETEPLDFDLSRVPLVYDQPYSGHYFVIQIDEHSYRSDSLKDQLLEIQAIAIDQSQHYYLAGPEQQPLLALGRGANKNGHRITLTVAEDLTDIGKEILEIRQAYLGLTLIILIVAIALQSLDVKRALRPLRSVQEELSKIAQGHQQQISTATPEEIKPLVNEVNRLIILIERRLHQSRTAIGNLAHALKTPLAVLVRLTEHTAMIANPDLNDLLKSQTRAIQERIDRELKHARLAGQIQTGETVNPHEEVNTLIGLLSNIYASKQLTIKLDAPDQAIPFDRQDFLEIIGNLADNACKWAKTSVEIRIQFQQRLTISVEDDGPGCSSGQLQQLAERGLRLDESVQGHGLGLAIVRDTAEFYGGSLQLRCHEKLGGMLAIVVI